MGVYMIRYSPFGCNDKRWRNQCQRDLPAVVIECTSGPSLSPAQDDEIGSIFRL